MANVAYFKRRTLFLLSLFPLGILLVFSSVSMSQTRFDTSHTTIPNILFGIHIHNVASKFYNVTTLNPWPSVPFATWRLWDASVTWADLEAQKGQWNFAVLDKAIALAEKHGVDVLLTLGQSPVWASARPDEVGPYDLGRSAEPRNIADWSNYVRTVAHRYQGKIHNYQIWNEVNNKDFFTGSIDQIVTLSQEAYHILKAVDPKITVVSPSITFGEPGLSALEEFFAKGGGKYADVISYHFYVVPHRPEEMEPLITKVRQLMNRYGLASKPLWNTESGWSDPKPFPANLGAAYVARAYIVNWAAGVSRFYWYAWDNDWWVSLFLVEADKRTLTSAGIAYREIQNWLIGARLISCETKLEQTRICQLNRDSGYIGWIVWNPERETQFRVPSTWGAQQLRSLSGTVTQLEGQTTISIGSTPGLIEKP